MRVNARRWCRRMRQMVVEALTHPAPPGMPGMSGVWWAQMRRQRGARRRDNLDDT